MLNPKDPLDVIFGVCAAIVICAACPLVIPALILRWVFLAIADRR